MRLQRALRATVSAVFFVALVVAFTAGCEDDSFNTTEALFELPSGAEQDLFALPFPNDVRVTADGRIDLARLGADQPVLIQRYLDIVAANELGGFATNGATYFRFSAPIDARSLPESAEASRQPGASLFWVNLQKGSANYGQRIPFTSRFVARAGRYAGENLLAVLPVPGFVLEAETRYAVVVTEGLVDENNVSVQPARDFKALLAAKTPAEARLHRAHDIYAPLRVYISEENLTGVVSAAVFTTGSPAGLVAKAREVVHRSAAPLAKDLGVAVESTDYHELRGTYEAPNFQRGDPPYMHPEAGGTIERNVAGEPMIARQETMRFALSVPKGTMPPKGWPVVLYAHGTGGSYRTFIRNGVAENLAQVKDGSGKVIAQMAVIGIDQVLHGPRAPAGTAVDLAFFNFQNPAASVANVLQGGIDNFQLLRLVKGLTFDSLPWLEGTNRSGAVDFGATKFDPERIYFMGHSQGGLTGPSFIAAEPELKAAVLSGAGGGAVISLLEKTAPIAIKPILEVALKEPADAYHPVMTLIQQLLEPADPNNYAPAFYHAPVSGLAAKHVFLSEGLVDHYTPPATTEALAVAMRAAPLNTVLSPVEGLALRGLSAAQLPTSGNVTVGKGTVTAGLLQYQAREQGKGCKKDDECGSGYCDDGRCRREGHFVMFDNDEARRHYSSFLATHARDGVPTILP